MIEDDQCLIYTGLKCYDDAYYFVQLKIMIKQKVYLWWLYKTGVLAIVIFKI